jgi:hypothetical protein
MSQTRKLHLVESNSKYKRYQFVSRSRRKINLKGGKGVYRTSNLGLSGKSLAEIENRDYLNTSYGPENFDSKLNTLKKSNQKVTIIRNGLEIQKELYTRD